MRGGSDDIWRISELLWTDTNGAVHSTGCTRQQGPMVRTLTSSILQLYGKLYGAWHGLSLRGPCITS